jgi:hypothetical protein
VVTRRSVLAGAIAVVLATIASLLRQPGAGALNTVWAEDGQVFLGQAAHSSFGALATSYAGYFHTIPRLLAGFDTLLPASAAAPLMAIEAALCYALIAVLVYHASAAHLASRLARVLAASVVVLAPLGTDELYNSIANIHWAGLYVVFWMLLWTPSSRAGRILAVAVVALVAASDILVLVFAPLALLRMLRGRLGFGRDRLGTALGVALIAGIGLQFVGLATGASSRALSPNPVKALTGFVLRAVPPTLIGEQALGTDVNARWLGLAALAWLIVAVIVSVALAKLTSPAWTFAVVAFVHSVGLYALPVVLSGTATVRYAAAPAMLLVAAFAALLQPLGPSWRERAPLVALTGLLALVAAVNFRVDNLRAHGPTWSGELDRARTACSTATADVSLAIPPDGHPDRWAVALPCTYVR